MARTSKHLLLAVLSVIRRVRALRWSVTDISEVNPSWAIISGPRRAQLRREARALIRALETLLERLDK